MLGGIMLPRGGRQLHAARACQKLEIANHRVGTSFQIALL